MKNMHLALADCSSNYNGVYQVDAHRPNSELCAQKLFPYIVTFSKIVAVQDLSILWRGKRLDATELDEYLEAYRLVLPQSFKNFLITYNGSSVRKNVFKQKYIIANVLPLKSVRGASIEMILDSYDVDLNTRNLFPFAIDNQNRVYVLPLVGAKAGQVWLDHGERDERFEYLTASFEEFINGLEE